MLLVTLIGNLGRDPEKKTLDSGQIITTLSIACKSKRGKDTDPIWVKAVIWGDRFDKLLPHIKKGSSVVCTGMMQKPTCYTDKSGVSRVNLEIKLDSLNFSPTGSGESTIENKPVQTSIFDQEDLPF